MEGSRQAHELAQEGALSRAGEGGVHALVTLEGAHGGADVAGGEAAEAGAEQVALDREAKEVGVERGDRDLGMG